MFGLPALTTFMFFIFWPAAVVAAGIWGAVAFKNESGENI
jgi:hypothetical protein